MPGKARWGQVWWVDTGYGENKRFVVVSEDGWNETFPSVLAVRLTQSANRRPGPGFPLIAPTPPTIALCGQVTTLPEEALIDIADRLTLHQMQEIAIGLLEVMQLHRLLGLEHPRIAPRTGQARRRR